MPARSCCIARSKLVELHIHNCAESSGRELGIADDKVKAGFLKASSDSEQVPAAFKIRGVMALFRCHCR